MLLFFHEKLNDIKIMSLTVNLHFVVHSEILTYILTTKTLITLQYIRFWVINKLLTTRRSVHMHHFLLEVILGEILQK